MTDEQRTAANVDGVHAAIAMIRAAPQHLTSNDEQSVANWNRELAHFDEVGLREWEALLARHDPALALSGILSGLGRIGGYFADHAASGRNTTREAMLNELAFNVVVEGGSPPDESD